MLRVIIFITCFGLTFFSCNKVRQKKTIKIQKEKLKKKRVHKKFTIPWDNFYLGNDKSGISLSALDTISICNTIADNNDKFISKSNINSNDPYLKEYRKCDKSSQLFYYSVLDTVNYYSVVFYIYGEYDEIFQLVNYSKKFKYIDDVTLCSTCEGYSSDIKFLNDSIFLRKDINFEFLYEEPDKSNEHIYGASIGKRMIKKWVIKLKLLKNGVIEVDTINRNDWYRNDWYSND